VVELAYSPDGKLLASGGDDSKVRIWRVGDGQLLRTLDHDGHHVYAVGFSRDGRYLATGGRDHGTFGELMENLHLTHQVGETVRIWNVADGRLLRTVKAQNDVHSVEFSPDGQWLATASEDHTVVLWRVSE
jgi:WD40 repeat protein